MLRCWRNHLTSGALAMTPHSKSEAITAVKRATERLARFDGWEVVSNQASKHIVLMDDDPDPSILIGCGSGGSGYLFSVRVIDQRDVFTQRFTPWLKGDYVRFLAWSDTGPAQEFTALVLPDRSPELTLAQLDVSTNPASHSENKSEVLWDMFKTSKVKFSYSTPSGLRSVKAGDLLTAVEYFETACRSIMSKRP
jgi:hypothetical protein